MVTGQQTVEFDLHAVEQAKTVVVWGMNWITTKMPDCALADRGAPQGHARSSSSPASTRPPAPRPTRRSSSGPGTTPALALGLAGVIMREKLYDADYVKRWTDLPILVRMDTLKYLRAQRRLRRRAGDARQPDARARRRREAAAAGRAARHARSPRRCAASGATTSGGTAPRTRRKPLTRDEVGAHSRGRRSAARRQRRGDAAGRQEGALPAGVRSGAGVRRPLRSEDRRGAHLGAGRRGRVAGARHRRAARHDAVRHRHGAEPVLQQRQQGPRHLPAGGAHRQRRQDRAATSARTPATTASRCSTARRSTSTRIRSTSSSIRPSRRGRSSTGRPSRRTTTTTRTIRCASATRCSPARRTCRRRPSRCGSPTPTRSSAT